MSSPHHASCILYCRVSSVKQVREGDGLHGQEKRCRDYTEARGYAVLRVFAEGVTGGTGDRPAMLEMLAFLEQQPGETVVVVDDIKRFARDVAVHFDLKYEILRRGGRLESPLFRFEDTPEGKFVETMLAAQAELERNQNRRQVVSRMRARLEQGYWTFHPPPGYVFRHDPTYKKVLTPDTRAPLVKEALEGFAGGRFAAPMDVQRFLQKAGFFGPSRPDDVSKHLWQIHRMLRQVLYAGHLRYPPWNIPLLPARHPALIPLETYERIQARLAARTPTATRATVREEFLLRGFVACAACGRALTGSRSRGRTKTKTLSMCRCQVHNVPICTAFGQASSRCTAFGQASSRTRHSIRISPDLV